MKFEMGQLCLTAGVSRKVKDDMEFCKFITKSIERYKKCDWGDTCKEDSKSNTEALKNDERIFAVYKLESTTIWIITEWDRSVTTVLFPSEY